MDAFFIFSAKYSFVFAVGILGVYFLTRRWPAQKRMALFAIPAGLLTYLLGFIANHLYYDPRPFVVDHFTPLIQHIADNGFPSDDTLLVAALAAVGMYWNKWLGTILWALTILVAVARVYVGVHHPIDVLSSIAFALIAVPAWYAIMNHVWKA
ncbi:MAG: phosphatase PAP2 family protein [Patescibacteria group bacterium]|nr:phosphatase PAP2 family protein [Patescibacteria group bacterium]